MMYTAIVLCISPVLGTNKVKHRKNYINFKLKKFKELLLMRTNDKKKNSNYVNVMVAGKLS